MNTPSAYSIHQGAKHFSGLPPKKRISYPIKAAILVKKRLRKYFTVYMAGLKSGDLLGGGVS